MAATTLLNAVTVNTVGTGVAITGDVDFSALGFMGGGMLEVQRSVDDVDANYKPVGPEGQFIGAGHCTVRNVGTNYYRGVLKGATQTANATLKSNQ